jgi:hypothetical protein
VRGSGVGSFGRKAELWSLSVLTSTGLGANKLAAVTDAPGRVSPGSSGHTHVVVGSSGDGDRSLSQMLDKVSLRLARASWLPQEGKTDSCPSLPELEVALVVSSWFREASSPMDEGLWRGLVSSAMTGSLLSPREILARELAVVSM